jgi:starch synthase
MAEAVAGLVRQLRRDGVTVTVALPDYGGVELAGERRSGLDVPEWAGPVVARVGILPDHGELTLIDGPGMAKPHPYNDPTGQAFDDNDRRFFAFSAGVAALARELRPDVLHVNDWHTAATLGLLADDEVPPSVLTIHTLAYQGVCAPEWMGRLARRADDFAWYGDTNPLLGGIRLADRVVTVSPNYADEILDEANGMGLHGVLAQLGPRLVGIINGIDTDEWNPAIDDHLVAAFDLGSMRGKAANRTALHARFGLDTAGPAQPLVGMVTRLVEQKGIDLAADAARFLAGMPARLAVLGSGDAHLADRLTRLATEHPGRIGFVDGYDATLSHLVFAGSDLLLMPSRFEPCGLAQMQAMAYGTIPVVTDVGGLHDTVVDADADPERGTGFVSRSVDVAGMVDALHRATRAWSSTRRRSAIRNRAMSIDWSWAEPAQAYTDLYRRIGEGAASPPVEVGRS